MTNNGNPPTAYCAWTHMAEQTQEATLKSLAEAGFNKVQMCGFPKNYNLVKDVPPLYPFELKDSITAYMTRIASGYGSRKPLISFYE